MKNKIITIVALIVLLAVSIFGYEMIFKRPLVESPIQSENQNDTEVRILDTKEQYINGVYTIAGVLQVPTPCHGVVSEVVPLNDGSYVIDINIVEPSPEIMCAQVIADKEFKVTFAASQDAEISARVNGVDYELNRISVPAGEDFDSFDIYIKG